MQERRAWVANNRLPIDGVELGELSGVGSSADRGTAKAGNAFHFGWDLWIKKVVPMKGLAPFHKS